jgi:hypothetical protein
MLVNSLWDEIIPILDDRTVVRIKYIEDTFDLYGYEEHEEVIEQIINMKDNVPNPRDMLLNAYLQFGIAFAELNGITFTHGVTLNRVFETLNMIYDAIHDDSEEKADWVESLMAGDEDQEETLITILTDKYLITQNEEDFNYVIDEISPELTQHILNVGLGQIDHDEFLDANIMVNKLKKKVGVLPDKPVLNHIYEYGHSLSFEDYWEAIHKLTDITDNSRTAVNAFYALNFANDVSMVVQDFMTVCEPMLSEPMVVRQKLIDLLNKK